MHQRLTFQRPTHRRLTFLRRRIIEASRDAASFRSWALLLMIAAGALGACGEKPERIETPPIDSSRVIVPLPMQGERGREMNPDNVEGFEELVYRHYARLAVSLPVREMDSIVKSVPPEEVEQQMTKRLHIQDTIARGRLADTYHIPRDSVDAILARHNVPKR